MHKLGRALQDKWRNIQKCEKRRKVPRREASQPCVSSVTSAPAGSARCRRLCVNLHSQQCAVHLPMPYDHGKCCPWHTIREEAAHSCLMELLA